MITCQSKGFIWKDILLQCQFVKWVYQCDKSPVGHSTFSHAFKLVSPHVYLSECLEQIAASCFGLKHKYKPESLSINSTYKFPVNVSSGLCSI